MQKHDGGPAFPVREPAGVHAKGLAAVKGITDTAERDRIYTEATTRAFSGMSLRDYFAASALKGLAGNPDMVDCMTTEMAKYCAEFAYVMADAMLTERAALEGDSHE